MTATSKKALSIKLVFACLLPGFSHLALNLIVNTYALIVFVVIGVLYSMPFSINSYFIRQAVLEQEKDVLKRFILTDLLYVTLPSILSAVLFEVLFGYFFEASGNGLAAVVLCVMFILISAMNWIMYPIKLKTAALSTKIKKPKKHDDQ